MRISTWFLPPDDPRRLAEEASQRKQRDDLERAAKLAGINIRPKVPS